MAEKLMYYTDGYHGGIRGHMPLGCWRDILRMLKECPEWKLSIDVEPISWDHLKERDPLAYNELREMLKDTTLNSRLEMVAGSYAQPYGWITDGESNIRHITMGLDIIHKHFPWIDVKTYAVQEPCWTSAMPQMLKSLGFDRAVLKNPSTAWGGYSAGFDAEVCWWEGPDGTCIPLVPRYACEELCKVWETESVYGDYGFAQKCIEHGINHPAGMYYQDLGWAAIPMISNKPGYEETYYPDYLQYTTWQEYFEQVANKPTQTWKVTQEAFLGGLPWGERLLVRMARQVRRGEVGLLNAERLCAIVNMLGGSNNIGDRLPEAWGHLLMTQHHDGWICAASGKGEHNWAWKTSAQIYAAESLTQAMDRHALNEISNTVCPAVQITDGQEDLVVVNPLSRNEARVVYAPITSSPGCQNWVVYDGDKRIESQYIASRWFKDESKNAGTLVFKADLPGYGVKTFRLKQSHEADTSSNTCAVIKGHVAIIENEYYQITFDLEKGGIISSLWDKQRNTEVVSNDSTFRFNEYRGFFVEEGVFHSNTETAAEATIITNGPICATIEITGKVSNVPYTQRVTVTTNEPAISIDINFHFPEKTYIGEPHVIEPEHDREEGYRSFYDDRYKLNAYFPTSFEQNKIYKDAAYDVCESVLSDTHFKQWYEIKHNIHLGWVEVSDGEQGVAVAADHTTGYIHGDGYPFGLTLAWG
ncbi:alpha-mannosidase [Clostridia bacterium]|nr:alpha-mannosidase [Clostridia bacterium]